jgi:cytochrome c-type biogenesis protein CcmF
LYPLFLDALDLGKASVGPPYFDLVFPILMAPAAFLMGIGPLASWRRAEVPDLWTRLRWAMAVALATALLLPLVLGRWSPLIAFGLFLALWIVAATVTLVIQRFPPCAARQLQIQARRQFGRVVRHGSSRISASRCSLPASRW